MCEQQSAWSICFTNIPKHALDWTHQITEKCLTAAIACHGSDDCQVSQDYRFSQRRANLENTDWWVCLIFSCKSHFCLTVAGTYTLLFYVIVTFRFFYWNDCSPTEHTLTGNMVSFCLFCHVIRQTESGLHGLEQSCPVQSCPVLLSSCWWYKFRFRYRGRCWGRPCSLAFYHPSNIPISFVLA